MTALSVPQFLLNPKQQEAVTLPLSNALILAGAGSGKTRVLVQRIIYLVEHFGLSPFSILAVTFTNKAAQEMRHRIEPFLIHQNINASVQSLWVGTFHGIAHRLLRMHWQEAGLSETFQVIDSDDQLRLIKRVMKELYLDEKQLSPKTVQHFINAQKDEGLRSFQVQTIRHGSQELVSCYKNYEQLCAQSHLVDFAELLLRTYELWAKNPALLSHYQEKFKALLVDEFQDTNRIQYLWLKILFAKNKNHLLVVGDDDQSIYGWRGAKVGNITEFQKDFSPVSLIRLEQNYRSTQTILNAANALIGNNTERMGKTLFCEDAKGEPIGIFSAFNELEEAHFITHEIQKNLSAGLRLKDMAILYRSNAQSRVLEEALLMAGLPYHVYGGMRFFERAEIKTALAYCRLVYSRDDDAAFERIINTPARSIGEKTQNLIRDFSKQFKISLWETAVMLVKPEDYLLTPDLPPEVLKNILNALPNRAKTALENFIVLIERMNRETQGQLLYEQVEHIIQYSGLIPFYQQEEPSKAESRLENLGELITAARTFIPENQTPTSDIITPETQAKSDMAAFLGHAVLESGETQASHVQDAVQLMTLHASKGLEFPCVFITGLEEGLFPSHPSLQDPHRLEEERRLMYVGITRAMKKLTLTYAESRRLYGESVRHFHSRFLTEIPPSLLNPIRHKNIIRRFSE